jgi:hypothetical protein
MIESRLNNIPAGNGRKFRAFDMKSSLQSAPINFNVSSSKDQGYKCNFDRIQLIGSIICQHIRMQNKKILIGIIFHSNQTTH